MFKDELYDAQLDCRIDVLILDLNYWEWQADNAAERVEIDFAMSVINDKQERLGIALNIKRQRLGKMWFVYP